MSITTARPVGRLYADADVMPPHSNTATQALPLVIAVAFTLVCVFLAQALNIWQDEAYSLHTTGSGIVNAWTQGIVFEAQAPLYFVLLALWRTLNASATYARLLSLVFSLVTLYATWDFARRYLRVAPSIVLTAVAFNPFTVWAAVEVRPYAASIAFSAVLLLLFFRGFIDSQPRQLARIAFVVFAVAGTYTMYYVASLVLACGVALLALRRRRAFFEYVAGSIAYGITLIPLAYVIPLQFHAYDAFAAAFRIPGYVMATVLVEYPFPHDWIGTWAHLPVQNAAYFAILAIPAGVVAASTRALSVTAKALIAIVATLFAFYTAVIAIAHIHVLIPRHSLVILVPLIALVFAVIGDVLPSRRRIAITWYASVFTCFSLLSYWHTYHNLSKTGDWERVAEFVFREAGSADAIAMFDAEAELPFRYYYRGNNPVQAIPHPESFTAFDEAAFVLHSERDVALSLGKIAEQHPRVWLVESNVCARQSAFFGCDYLTSYIKRHFRVLSTTTFDGSTVSELQRTLAASL